LVNCHEVFNAQLRVDGFVHSNWSSLLVCLCSLCVYLYLLLYFHFKFLGFVPLKVLHLARESHLLNPFYGFTTYSDTVKTQVIGNCICSRFIQIFWSALSEFIPNTFIRSFSILSDDRSKASSKTIPPHSAS